MPKPIGNMFWFADWELCREYDPGDVVERAGVLFLCLEENAGHDPADPFNRNFWKPFGDGGTGEGVVPPGGLLGQVLAKKTDDNFDLVWQWINANLHYRGTFKTGAQLIAAHPTDIPGAYASVMETFTIWLWDDELQRWDDTGKSGVYVQTVNGKTGPDVLLTADDIPGVEKLANKNRADGYPGLDAEGLLPVERLPMKGGKKDQVWGKKSDADNDMGWVDQKGGGAGGEHNGLDGLQGGKPESAPGADDAERYHLTKDEHSFVGDIHKARPLKPANLSPRDGETNVPEQPMFESSPYANPYGVEMYGYQLQIYSGSGVLVYDSGNVEVGMTMYKLRAGVLLENLPYSWRVRYQSANLLWSEWSDRTTFTTSPDFGSVVYPPALLKPAQGDVYNSSYPTLITTPFSATGGLVQAAGDFQISDVADFSSIVEEGQGVNVYAGSRALSRGVPYYARARHRSTTGKVSDFSYPHAFTVKNLYREQRIGIVLTDEANLLFQRVDGNYLPIDLDADYWPSNAIWAGWDASLNRDGGGVPAYTDVGGNKMIVMPAFWIKSGRVPSGPYAGKRMWLIDPGTPTQAEKEDGWHVHPAFIRPDGGVQDSLFVSAFMCSVAAGNKAASINAAPAAGTWETWIPRVNNINTDSSNPLTRGWQLLPYYVYELFKLLAMIEYGGTARFHYEVCEPNNNYNSVGYRGVKLWNRSPACVPILMTGLMNGQAFLPGGMQWINLPGFLIPASYTPGSGVKKLAPGEFLSVENGVSASLYPDDYMIFKARTPVTEGAVSFAALYASYSAAGQSLPLVTRFGTAQAYNDANAVPANVLGYGNAGNPAGASVDGANFNAMLIKYD